MKIILAVLFITVLPAVGEAQGWRGIVPLRSTRVDVERLLGRPLEGCMHTCVYRGDDMVIAVKYTDGATCEGPLPRGWTVPLGTVESVRIEPRARPRLSELGIQAGKYKRWDAGGDVMGIYHYVDEEGGLTIEVDENPEGGIRRPHKKDGRVLSLTYGPTKADNRLRCESQCNAASPRAELFVATGSQYGETWEEDSRFVVRMPSAAPTVGEVLAELRRHDLPGMPRELRPYFTLRREGIREEMEESRTVGEYGLRNCSVLRLLAFVR